MTTQHDFYVAKYAVIRGLQHSLSQIIKTATEQIYHETLCDDNPDVAMYTKLIEKMTKAKMSLDFPLANVERMMNE